MRDIFTYPNNESTYYVDPNYIGDDTVGFQGRVKDMIDEAIGGSYNWAGTAPQYSLADTLIRIGKYYRYYDNISRNNLSIYDMSQATLAEFELSEKSIPLLNIKHSPTEPLQFGTTDPSGKWGLRDGRDFYWHPGVDGRDITNVSAYQRDWYDIGLYVLTATSDSTDTVIAIEPNKNTYWQTHDGLNSIHPSFIKYGPNGSVVKTISSMGSMPSPSRGFKKQDFTEAHDTGTLNTGDVVYFKDEFSANYTRTCYTDAACTIPATLDENYIVPNTAVFTITAAAGTTTDFDFSQESLEGVLSLADLQTLYNWGSNFAYGRMYYQNLTGTGASIVTKVLSNQDISDSLANSYYDNTYNAFAGTPGTNFQFAGLDNRNGTAMDGQLVAGATQAASVEIHVEFINAARMQSDDAFWTVYTGTEEIDGKMVRTNHYDSVNDLPYWGIDSELSKVYIPGNSQYRYRDTNGDFQYGAEFSNDVWFPGEIYAQDFANWSNIVDAPNIQPSIDSNGRSDGNINFNGAGNFAADSEPFILRVQSLPDEYVPPAPTPEQIAAAEDNFDTNDDWDNFTGYSGGTKIWPRIPPKSARIDFKTPTLQTTSQSGIKYARHAGYTRYGLDVTYPPLKKDEMAEMQAYSQLARGGAVVFTFDIDPLNTGSTTGFGFLRNYNGSTSFPTIKEVDLNNNTYLLEGFDSNHSQVFKEGQLIGSPNGARNGGAFLALNTVDANIYGEARLKFGFNDDSYNNNLPGTGLWLGTDTLTVSLSEDTFQYVERGDGLYDCSVRFDLDFWK